MHLCTAFQGAEVDSFVTGSHCSSFTIDQNVNYNVKGIACKLVRKERQNDFPQEVAQSFPILDSF